VVMTVLMKLFRTTNKDIIDECRFFCNFPLPTEMLETKSNKFCKKYKCDKSMLAECYFFDVTVTLLHMFVKLVRIWSLFVRSLSLVFFFYIHLYSPKTVA